MPLSQVKPQGHIIAVHCALYISKGGYTWYNANIILRVRNSRDTFVHRHIMLCIRPRPAGYTNESDDVIYSKSHCESLHVKTSHLHLFGITVAESVWRQIQLIINSPSRVHPSYYARQGPLPSKSSHWTFSNVFFHEGINLLQNGLSTFVFLRIDILQFV